MHRLIADPVAGVDIRAYLQQQGRHPRVARLAGQVQGGVARRIAALNLGAMPQEKLRRLHCAGLRRHVERRKADLRPPFVPLKAGASQGY